MDGGKLIEKRALITGVTGQDGFYLSKLLLSKGYKVFGLVRRTSRSAKVPDGVHVMYGDLTDQGSLNRAVLEACPDECYNLGAQSFVGSSWKLPVSTMDITGLGALRMLEAIRQFAQDARYYQASSSEMLGNVQGVCNEQTPFAPRSPYGVAKAAAHHMTINYRESFGIFACAGILLNHSSPRRGEEFVTRKVTKAVAKISLGQQEYIELGNLDAARDWHFAGDAVLAMWQMLQQDEPAEYVIASGKAHTIRDLLTVAFSAVGIHDWTPYVRTSDQHKRPAEIHTLIGDASKAKRELGWVPSMDFHTMIKLMVDSDLDALKL